MRSLREQKLYFKKIGTLKKTEHYQFHTFDLTRINMESSTISHQFQLKNFKSKAVV